MFKLYILLLLSYFALACNQNSNSNRAIACGNCICNCGRRKRDVADETEFLGRHGCDCHESENDANEYFEESLGQDLDCPEDQKQFICKSGEGGTTFYR